MQVFIHNLRILGLFTFIKFHFQVCNIFYVMWKGIPLYCLIKHGVSKGIPSTYRITTKERCEEWSKSDSCYSKE